MRIFFTSDHHFGHENIIKFCNRPFETVEEMDDELIKRWNEKVRWDDKVYHLGDLTLRDTEAALEYLSRLNGDITILCNPWHHDRRWLAREGLLYKYRPGFRVTTPMMVLEFPELGKGKWPQIVVLCHYPLAEWDRKHYGAWHLHGHSHGKHDGEGLILDVGVDCHDFYPVTLDEIVERYRPLIK